MSRLKVYLAGPMELVSLEDMTGWRRELTHLLAVKDIEVYDPCVRIPIHLTNPTMNHHRKVFHADLMDIDNCDVVFANVQRDAGRGTGTSMEIMYSWMKHKPVILWVKEGDPEHPFYESIYCEKHTGLAEAANAIAEFRK